MRRQRNGARRRARLRGGAALPGELAAARDLLRGALSDGALGVTLGVVYAPEYNYDADGFTEVLSPMREYPVPLVAHVRGEGDLLHESLREVIGIARRLGTPLHVSHLKCIGRRNWGRGAKRALEILEEARARGLRADCDVYPYTAGSTQLLQILPPHFLEGGAPGIIRRLREPARREELRGIFAGPSDRFENLVYLVGWENIRCTSMRRPENQPFIGKSVAEIARRRGQDPCDCACDLLAAEECDVAMIDFITSEEDVRTILRSPMSSVISDSVYPSRGVPHPRLYGAFPKVLIDYVRESPLLTLEEAVHKMTAKPAGVYRLGSKGLLLAGFDADINVFSLENLKNPASYEHPAQYASGFDYVFVNGRAAVDHDELTARRGQTAEAGMRAAREQRPPALPAEPKLERELSEGLLEEEPGRYASGEADAVSGLFFRGVFPGLDFEEAELRGLRLRGDAADRGGPLQNGAHRPGFPAVRPLERQLFKGSAHAGAVRRLQARGRGLLRGGAAGRALFPVQPAVRAVFPGGAAHGAV